MYNYYDYRPDFGNPIVYSHALGDVNGDRIPDNVYLTGIRTQDSLYVQNITLLIQDGKTGLVTTIPLKVNAGYSPFLFLGDFTGHGVNDILVSIASGGSGGIMFYYIFSFLNNRAVLLFDFEEYNEQYPYDVIYKDNYKVEVISQKNKSRYIIDISGKGPGYLNEIYDSNRKLKEPISGWVDPLSGLYPVDFDLNGIYELLAYQGISGRYHADGLGYVMNSLQWGGREFVLRNQNVAIFGTDI